MVALTPFDAPHELIDPFVVPGHEVAPLHDLQFLVGRLGVANENQRPRAHR
jgi:hypothetical protein